MCDSSSLNCDVCDTGFYAFLNFGAPATFRNCFDCQQLNCASGGCSNGIGESAAPCAACMCGVPLTTAWTSGRAATPEQCRIYALYNTWIASSLVFNCAGCTSCPSGFLLNKVGILPAKGGAQFSPSGVDCSIQPCPGKVSNEMP